MFEEFAEIDLPQDILESIEDMTGELLELKCLILSLALNAHRLPEILPGAPRKNSN